MGFFLVALHATLSMLALDLMPAARRAALWIKYLVFVLRGSTREARRGGDSYMAALLAEERAHQRRVQDQRASEGRENARLDGSSINNGTPLQLSQLSGLDSVITRAEDTPSATPPIFSRSDDASSVSAAESHDLPWTLRYAAGLTTAGLALPSGSSTGIGTEQ
jgi:hypothetical protein